MGNRRFVGMMAAGELGDENNPRSFDSLSPEEREKYTIAGLLDEDYRKKTFREVAEYLIKDKNILKTNEQRTAADKVRVFMQQHNPPDFECFFHAYKQEGNDVVAVRNPNGKEKKFALDESITSCIDTRKTGGEEYDCIDLLCAKTSGQGNS